MMSKALVVFESILIDGYPWKRKATLVEVSPEGYVTEYLFVTLHQA